MTGRRSQPAVWLVVVTAALMALGIVRETLQPAHLSLSLRAPEARR